jgi:hypothetical protein
MNLQLEISTSKRPPHLLPPTSDLTSFISSVPHAATHPDHSHTPDAYESAPIVYSTCLLLAAMTDTKVRMLQRTAARDDGLGFEILVTWNETRMRTRTTERGRRGSEKMTVVPFEQKFPIAQ